MCVQTLRAAAFGASFARAVYVSFVTFALGIMAATPQECANNKTNTAHGVYAELENIAFPRSDADLALGESCGTLGMFVKQLAASLKVPYGAALLGMVALASFMAHRTVAQYTPMLGVPALPWMLWLGNSGDGKSKLIWWMKQVIKACEKRATNRAMLAYKEEVQNS